MENSKKRALSLFALVVMAIAILVGMFALPTQNAVAEEGIQPFGADSKNRFPLGAYTIYFRLNAIDYSKNDEIYIRVNVEGSDADHILAKYCFVFLFEAFAGSKEYAYFTSETDLVTKCDSGFADESFKKTASDLTGDNDNSSYSKMEMGQLRKVDVWGWIWCDNEYYELYRNYDDNGNPEFKEVKFNS